MADVYVLVPLGTEPSVVTELLWHLTVEQGHHVRGVEIWGTHSDDNAPKTSLRSLRDRVVNGLWRDLRRILEARGVSERLPELSDRYREFRPQADAPLASPLRVTYFERDGRPIPDVRNDQDAEAVASQLHARVRHLCGALRGIVLIGSIAGGRKNFSSALQGAFELQARREDRLLHVLLHEEIEEAEAILDEYVAPEREVLGIPVEEQLTVVDVPFPPLRSLLPPHIWRNALDHGDTSTLWARLRQEVRGEGERRACLEPHDRQRWRLVLEGSGELVADLTGGQAETYLAVSALPGAGFDAWGQHIHNNRLGRQAADPEPPDEEAVRTRLSSLVRATRDLRARGFGEFAVVQDGARTHIPAGDRVRVRR